MCFHSSKEPQNGVFCALLAGGHIGVSLRRGEPTEKAHSEPKYAATEAGVLGCLNEIYQTLNECQNMADLQDEARFPGF